MGAHASVCEVKQPQCAPVSTTMLACCPNGRASEFQRDPPKTLSTQRPPPHSTVTTARTADWTGPLGQISRQTTRTLRIDALARRASTAGQARGRARPHHYHNTHASPTRPHARAHRHPALTSRGIHHIECSTSAPHLRSSAPPLLRHSTAPRGKHACESTHTSIANAPCLSVRSSKRICVDVAGD